MTTHVVRGWTIRVWPCKGGLSAVSVPWRFRVYQDREGHLDLSAATLSLNDFPNAFTLEGLRAHELTLLWDDFVMGRDRLFRYQAEATQERQLAMQTSELTEARFAERIATFLDDEEIRFSPYGNRHLA